MVRRRSAARAEAAAGHEPVNLALNVPAEGKEKQILSALFGEVVRERDLAPLLRYHPHGGIWKHREQLNEPTSARVCGSAINSPSHLEGAYGLWFVVADAYRK